MLPHRHRVRRCNESPELGTLKICANAIAQGASVVNMGRTIFQPDSPIAMIQTIEGLVHGGLTAEQTFEKHNDLKPSK